MKHRWLPALSGGLSGLANGLFGGGGGMVLVPLLSRFGTLPARKLYPTCVAVILPVCATSAAVYLLRDSVSLSAALPYLLGGLVGGYLGGRLYSKVPTTWLRYLFAAFLIYAGVKHLL